MTLKRIPAPPCPFCGGTELKRVHGGKRIRCDGCGANVPIGMWNRRDGVAIEQAMGAAAIADGLVEKRVAALRGLMREARDDFHGKSVLFSAAFLEACDE